MKVIIFSTDTKHHSYFLNKIAELSGDSETLNAELENKNKELAELKKQPATENLNTNKFKSNKVEFKEVSALELSNMSTMDRFRYNLNKNNN